MVEVCTDEMQPLLLRGLLRPLDEKAVPAFDELAFSDAPEVRDDDGNVLFVPASAGPQGLIVNTDEVDPDDVDLVDRPVRRRLRGRRGARGDAADRDRRGGAGDRAWTTR